MRKGILTRHTKREGISSGRCPLGDTLEESDARGILFLGGEAVSRKRSHTWIEQEVNLAEQE